MNFPYRLGYYLSVRKIIYKNSSPDVAEAKSENFRNEKRLMKRINLIFYY